MTTAPPRSDTIAPCRSAVTEPRRSRSTYMSTSMTPCDASPCRSASTRPLATSRAASCGTPTAANNAATKPVSVSDAISRGASGITSNLAKRAGASSRCPLAGTRRPHALLERSRNLVEGAADMVAIELQRFGDVVIECRPHQLLVLAHIVARGRARQDGQRHVALRLLEQACPDRQQGRRVARCHQGRVKRGVIATPCLADRARVGRIDLRLPRHPMERAEEVGLPRETALFQRPAQCHRLDLDPGL